MWSLVGWLPVSLAIAVSPGLALWPLLHEPLRGYMVDNDLSIEYRGAILESMGWSAIAVLVLYGIGWVWMRDRQPGLRVGEACRRINRYAFIALGLPLMSAFAVDDFEVDEVALSTLILLGVGSMLVVWVYRLSASTSRFESLADGSARLPRVLTALLGLGYFGAVSYLALLDHRNLGTHTYDLGIYDNILWQTAHGNFLGCSLIKGGEHTTAHFDPILALLVPIYWVFPRAETLLVFQTLWLATGILPLYLIARRELGNEWFGCLLTATYVFYPALHGVNLFDFHSLTLVVPLVLWAVYLLDEGPDWRFLVVYCLILATREDMALLSLGLALYAFAKRHHRVGVAIAIVSIGYLASVKLFVMADASLLMPGGKETYSYTYFFEELIPHKAEGAKGLLVSVLTNPAYTLDVLTKEDKVAFFFHLLWPLLFVPFLSGKKVLLFLYGLAFIGVASRKHVFSLHFQYSSVLFPFLMAAIPAGLARVRETRIVPALGLDPRRAQWSVSVSMVLVCVLVSSQYGAIIPNDSFRAGWNKIVRLPSKEIKQRYRRVREMIALIPDEAAVSSTSELGPHVSNRAEAYRWPVVRSSDYLLLRKDNFKAKDHRRLKRELDRKKYELVDDHGTIALYRRLVPRDAADQRAVQRKAAIEPGKGDAKREGAQSPSQEARPRPEAPHESQGDVISGDPPIRGPKDGRPAQTRAGVRPRPANPAG